MYKWTQSSLYLFMRKVGVRSLPKAPYLIHETAKAPHITGSWVFPVVDGLRSCPSHWYFSSTRKIVVLIFKVSGHTKIAYLPGIWTKSIVPASQSFPQVNEGALYLTLQILSLEMRMFLAARSRWTKPFPERYVIPKQTWRLNPSNRRLVSAESACPSLVSKRNRKKVRKGKWNERNNKNSVQKLKNFN